MKTANINNSFVKKITADNGVLTITFSNGDYVYKDIPGCLIDQLFETEHKGTFYRNYIRNCYPCTKL